MHSHTVKLNELDENVTLKTYIWDDLPENNIPCRPAIVIFPGGGYTHLSWREGEPVGMRFFAEGFNVFILAYSLNEAAKFPAPLVDASLAVAHVRNNAAKYNLDENKIFVLGYSAGGHLAACLATMWHLPICSEGAPKPIKYGSNRPDGVILSYSLITCTPPHALDVCTELICGNKLPTDDDMRKWSAEEHISEKTPPIFMWSCDKDPVVPVQNSLLFAMKLAEKNIPFEMRIYNGNVHGIALGNKYTSLGNKDMEMPHLRKWIPDAVEWCNRI